MKKSKSQIFSAGVLLRLANNALKRSSVENAEAQVAVILIYAAVECSLNDYIGMIFSAADASDPRISLFLEVMDELNDENASVKKRLRMANFILHGEKLDFGRDPFQDYAQLISLRNALIHRYPDPLIPRHAAAEYFDIRYQKTVDFLIAKGIYILHDGVMSLPTIQNLAHSEPVAKWAVDTGVKVLKEFKIIFGGAIPFEFSTFEYDTLEIV